MVLTLNENNYDKVTQSRRINIVPEIRLCSENIAVLEYICRAVIEEDIQLKRLVLSGSVRIEIDLLDPELLSQAVIRLQKFEIDVYRLQDFERENFELSQTQMDSLFTAIHQSGDLKLKRLDLGNRDYSEVPSEILASALVRLEDTNILYKLSENQVECLFNIMANSEIMNIQYLCPRILDTSKVSPEVFAAALVRVRERVRNPGAWHEEKMGAFLSKIASLDNMNLKRLSFHTTGSHSYLLDLSSVSPAIVSEAFVKLERLDLYKILQPNLYHKEILTMVGHCEKLKLKVLHIGEDNDLSLVSPEVLVQAVSRLESVSLYNCYLSASQLHSLLSQVPDGNCLRVEKFRPANRDDEMCQVTWVR